MTGSQGTILVENDRLIKADLQKPLDLPPQDAGNTNASASSPVISDVRGHRAVLEDFLSAIRTNGTPLCDGREGRRSVELVEAIYKASRTGQAVVLKH
jgi:predicted dehydrogenase